MKNNDLLTRTKKFSIAILKLSMKLPQDSCGKNIANQIIRAGTSTAANYRAAGRGKSDKDFLYKINIAEEEADETQFWLEIIGEAGLLPYEILEPLTKEAGEITAILTSIGKKMKLRINTKS